MPSEFSTVAGLLARAERSILEPIVEGEVALRVAEMRESLTALHGAMAAATRQHTVKTAAAALPIAEQRMDDRRHALLQLRELCLAANALQQRATRVEPDEKRVQEEVDAFIQQARQFLISLRQLEQADQPN